MLIANKDIHLGHYERPGIHVNMPCIQNIVNGLHMASRISTVDVTGELDDLGRNFTLSYQTLLFSHLW